MHGVTHLCAAVLAASLLANALADDKQISSPAKAVDAAKVHPVSVSPADVRQILAILEDGFSLRLVSLRTVQSNVDSDSEEPRVQYAYGIVLLRRLKYRDALKAFEAATDAGDTSYLPAWQALIRTRLLQRDYNGGIDDAEKLVRLLRDASTSWSTPEDRTEGANWLGRMVAACTIAEVEPDEALTPAGLDVLIRRFFDDDLEAAYDAGRNAVAMEYRHQLVALNKAQANAELKQKQEQKEQTARIEGRKQELEDQTVSLERNAKDLGASLDEQLHRNEKELTRLQADYNVLNVSLAKLTAAMATLQVEISNARIFSAQQDPNSRIASVQIISAAGQLAKYQADQATQSARLDAVIAKAESLLSQRAAIIDRYGAASGELAKQDATLKKWKRNLAKTEQDSPAGTNTIPASIRARKNRLTRISTYLDLDLQAEKERLLAEIKQSG